MKRDYVQLAHVFVPKKHGIAGWFASEKLDGMRAWWDSGVSRGMPANEVPYCNCVKDARYIESPVCTGLFSRYGNPIQAPNWFLDALPTYPLDGELWIKRNSFQLMSSIVKKIIPGAEWNDVKYMVFDSPMPRWLFMDGEITVQKYKVVLKGCYQWYKDHGGKDTTTAMFVDVLNYLKKNLIETDNLKLHKQVGLTFDSVKAVDQMYSMLDAITSEGGEGVILRKVSSVWDPKRVHTLLKVKQFQDDEAVVIGYTTGRKTDKGSKLLGLMGALILNYNGQRLELSGFTEEERVLSSTIKTQSAQSWAEEHPEHEVPPWIYSEQFPRGSKVTFRYRELTDDLIPKEARYWRKVD